MTGGIHFTLHAREILEHCPTIDWIVLAEGEETIVDLVAEIESGRRDLDRIDGLAFRRDGQVIVHPKTRFIEDIDQIPMPAYDLIRMEDYFVDTSGLVQSQGPGLPDLHPHRVQSQLPQPVHLLLHVPGHGASLAGSVRPERGG